MSTGLIIICLGISGLVITSIAMLVNISKKRKRERELVHSNSNFNSRRTNQFEDYNDETVSLVEERVKQNSIEPDRQQPSSNTIFATKYNTSMVTLKKNEDKQLEEEKYLQSQPFSQLTNEYDDKTESLVDVEENLDVRYHTQQNNAKPRFCTNCGSINDEDYKFCTNCGNKR